MQRSAATPCERMSRISPLVATSKQAPRSRSSATTAAMRQGLQRVVQVDARQRALERAGTAARTTSQSISEERRAVPGDETPYAGGRYGRRWPRGAGPGCRSCGSRCPRPVSARNAAMSGSTATTFSAEAARLSRSRTASHSSPAGHFLNQDFARAGLVERTQVDVQVAAVEVRAAAGVDPGHELVRDPRWAASRAPRRARDSTVDCATTSSSVLLVTMLSDVRGA